MFDHIYIKKKECGKCLLVLKFVPQWKVLPEKWLKTAHLVGFLLRIIVHLSSIYIPVVLLFNLYILR